MKLSFLLSLTRSSLCKQQSGGIFTWRWHPNKQFVLQSECQCVIVIQHQTSDSFSFSVSHCHYFSLLLFLFLFLTVCVPIFLLKHNEIKPYNHNVRDNKTLIPDEQLQKLLLPTTLEVENPKDFSVHPCSPFTTFLFNCVS